jgi:hypothetical protein
VWTSNASGPRADLFVVEVPYERLLEELSDSGAPTAWITQPAPGATVSGTVEIVAGAGDDVSVAGVRFEVDSQPLGVEDTVPPYTQLWATEAWGPGTHVLTAIARDAAGHETWSSSVTVEVALGGGGDPTGGGSGGNGGSSPSAVTWTDAIHCTASNGTLTKVSGGDGVDDARAISEQILRRGGYLRFRAHDTHSVLYSGLSAAPSAGQGFAAIDYAIRLGPWNGTTGVAEVRENGVWKADVPFQAGDVFEVRLRRGWVRYVKNGMPFHVSATRATAPLRSDASILTIGGTVADAELVVVHPLADPSE